MSDSKWPEPGCIPPYSRQPQHLTMAQELDALEAKLAFIEQGLNIYFGIDSTILIDMKAEAVRLRAWIEEARAEIDKPRETELL